MRQFRESADKPMSHSDRPETDIDIAIAEAAKPICRALVPMAFTERRARRRWYRWSPNPLFVAHLIAEAEQVPQARRMRRGSVADAQAAYQNRPVPAPSAGSRTRQVI
jgi:hypothetical protein